MNYIILQLFYFATNDTNLHEFLITLTFNSLKTFQKHRNRLGFIPFNQKWITSPLSLLLLLPMIKLESPGIILKVLFLFFCVSKIEIQSLNVS